MFIISIIVFMTEKLAATIYFNVEKNRDLNSQIKKKKIEYILKYIKI